MKPHPNPTIKQNEILRFQANVGPYKREIKKGELRTDIKKNFNKKKIFFSVYPTDFVFEWSRSKYYYNILMMYIRIAQHTTFL